ncbi:EAL domain, c-di-GMP-specific phosphodiesterase class I (or its enzymatically inactive variant) [Oscillibacter sp. PC13]|uniref:putative bifunctional diguanylate cyclase/phosphodiesterase n=1 Tax=Oscillibacter sp. PC13 TaxID=1855299 RepID=UPI0008EAD5C9|nr:bifunctional diguanylate cyclase/phosphodiesterase [Oscillibacter sp. PC13]SFP08132.1 EAL domain, c-di-GMP-specific phosphodiesterase class I (or its enzymatically inactive variant) [Oscillibacter sp. PC13]
MIRWSLIAEFFSLLIITIIFLRYYGYERHVAFTENRKLFLLCLVSSFISILLDICGVFTTTYPSCVPLWLNLLINSSYFLAMVFTCSLFAYFIFRLILEHVYDKHCLHQAVRTLACLTAVYTLFVLVNLFTGVLFFFDENGLYCRGPLNQLGFALPVIELGLLTACYLRNRASVSKPVIAVMQSLPPIVLVVVLFQVFYPEVLLNGALCSLTSLLLFISFQTHINDRDALTGLRNRSNFLTELSLRITSRQPLHIIAVSLHSLSDINMQYGHTVGDALLYEIAQELDRLFPQGRAFRISSLTFALTLPWESQDQSDACLDIVRRRLRDPWILGEIRCQLSCCMADLRCDEEETADRIMEYLEYTLGLAKQEHTLVRFDAEIRHRLEQKHAMIAIMRKSIQERRFRVWYQPLYCCQAGTFHSAEALLRLSDYDGNSISPNVFIPLAEETGMIGDLTWIVLEEVCRLLRSGAVPGLQSVSLNLSMQQLLDPHLTERIQQYLTQYQLRPEQLKIEITERFLLHDAEYARSQLESLTGAGLEIYMDDFGTGYSNLSSVLNFPFSCIKFDRSLMLHVPEDPQAVRMLQTLTALFHDMDKRLVAEGVEDAEQAAYIKDAGVDIIQGFYYAKPMPQDQLAAFFAEQQEAQT